MKKEVKTEEKKKSVIYAAIAIVAVIVGIVAFFKPEANNETIVVNEQITEAKAEPTTARIDITTQLVDADTPQFEVYVDDTATPVTQAAWMPKYNIQGNVVQKEGNEVDIVIKAIKDADIDVVLKGPWEQDESGKLVENWVKYSSASVNEAEILQEEIYVWHNKPFHYTLNVKAGEEYKIHAEWTKADDKVAK